MTGENMAEEGVLPCSKICQQPAPSHTYMSHPEVGHC